MCAPPAILQDAQHDDSGCVRDADLLQQVLAIFLAILTVVQIDSKRLTNPLPHSHDSDLYIYTTDIYALISLQN